MAISTVGTAVIQLSFDGSGVKSEMDKSASEFKKAGTEAGSNFGTALTVAMGSLISKGVSKVISTINSNLSSAINRVDVINNFPKVMSSLGFSADEAAASIKTMSSRLDGLPTTMNGIVSDVQKLTATMGNLNQGTVNATTLGLALNDMFLAGGKGTEAASSAMEQYNQMLAQGKPDMQSWRSMLNAAPGQLNQLAKTLLGATATQNDLYNALQKGTIKFDQLSEAIVKLDQEGGEGFESFEKQARAATGGVGTALQNVQSRISKAIAVVIDEIGGENIANVINSVSSHFGDIGKAVAKFVKTGMEQIGNFVRFLSNNLWITDAIKTAFTTILAFEIAVKIANIKTKLVDLFGKITAFVAAHPVLAIASAFGALITAVINFTSREYDFINAIRATREESEKAVSSYNELAEARQQNLQQQMNEIDYYNDLHAELLDIVDENGKVKEGYESRAKYITNELSKALGIEISLNDDIIDSWEDINGQISKNIEMRYKQAQLNAEEEAYTEALKKRASSLDRITEMERQLQQLKQEGTVKAALEAIQTEKALEAEKDLYKKYNWDIQRYTDDTAAFLEGRYNDMSESIWTYTDTLTESDLKNQATLENSLRETEDKLKYNEQLYKETGMDIYKQNAESYQRLVDDTKNKLKQYDGVVQYTMESVKNGFCKKIDETVVKAATKNGQFTSLGKNQVNSVANGMNSQTGNMFNAGTNAINAFTNGGWKASGNALSMIQNVANNISAIAGSQYGNMYVNGQNLMYGLGDGLASRGLAVVSNVFNQFMSDFKFMFGIHSPSTVFRDQIGVMLARGLGIGFIDEMGSVTGDMAGAIPTSFGSPAYATAWSSAGALESAIMEQSETTVSTSNNINLYMNNTIDNDMSIDELGRKFSQSIRRYA